MLRKLSLLLLLASSTCVLGGTVPKGFTVPDDTRSPDGRYGVTVPILAENPFTGNFKDWDHLRNSLVNVQTGRVLAVIRAGTVGWDRMGHGEILPPRWSSDGSLLIWQVDGKWSDDALVVLKLHDGKVRWQTNVLKVAEQAILDRTKQTAPKKYALVKRTNAAFAGGTDDPHCAYPDGFSIQVDALDPVSFPLRITAELTSEAKPGTEMYGVLASNLTGVLDADGKLTVTSFHLGPKHPSHFSED